MIIGYRCKIAGYEIAIGKTDTSLIIMNGRRHVPRERKPKGGRKPYALIPENLFRVEEMDADEVSRIINLIECDPGVQMFLNLSIQKPKANLSNVSPTMIMKIENETDIRIEPMPSAPDEEITTGEGKRRTLVQFFDKHKWLELNTRKPKESICKWISIYKMAAKIDEEDPDDGRRIHINADGSITAV